MNERQHSVAGGWLGTYTYRGSQRTAAPVRFEATLAAGETGHFSGTILDDGPGGEARTDGVQDGNHVRFTKIYADGTVDYTDPVEYEGVLSEDGRMLKGIWQIDKARLGHGGWEARRLWFAEGEREQTAEPEIVTDELTMADT